MVDPQLLRPEEHVVYEQDYHYEFRASASQCRSFDSEPGSPDGDPPYLACREDQEEIEDHVQDAHQDVEDARDFHVPAALEHPGAECLELKDGDECHYDHEVGAGVCAYAFITSEPVWQVRAYGYPYGGEHQP